jgi:predicted RNA-binding Zn ribbon-like protein
MENEKGDSKFKYVGGNPAVDFVNTVAGWTHRPPLDHLIGYHDVAVDDKFERYEDLLDWARGAGVVSDSNTRRLGGLAKRFPLAAESVLDRAVRLRRAIYRILLSGGPSRASFASDLDVLNTEIGLAREKQRLILNGNRFELGWLPDDSLDQVLWPVAVSAAALLISDELTRLRQCRGPNCGWLFLDTSRNHSRTWCNMKDCGNIAKVRRFRERQKQTA